MTYQQGDVLIQKVGELPADLETMRKGKRGYVLAEGEVTGHAHRIKDDIRLYRDGNGQPVWAGWY